MSNGTTQPQATLDAWREQGADAHDPLRFHFIDALARRAAQYDGETRRLLDARLCALLDAYAADVADHASQADVAERSAGAGKPSRGPLAGLVDYIASQASETGERTPNSPAVHAELKALDYFRETWSKVSAEKQLRQSLEQVPGNAGPLNSSSLVHRSLSLMRELSPGYLQQFLSYVDALSWMEQLTGSSVQPVKEAPRAASAKKGTRGKSR
ncbi:DUF2894 domain-containing protein [Paraburkholderia phymatum]|uniref:DUF2894 domain-containing protein n=1 Tax=Paraburkholderia phymatum (strain DSM 17167 / CIP 108236 / LMG 21445 / STM815) TaxID=391038 RepID=B2JWX9_PARP8|nr:DUF2894 domain-containing protein [Paraburkholderia phymatum]ACC75456.1 conserved hypothetical protein [Paraburkholderia phymatum STM815]